uniref:Sialyltransferase n=1 Tax=Globodera pallida TaxID=36090 RepID=A0A183CE76_GLOPA
MASEHICSMDTFEIPRPKCVGMQFVPIRGRYGYYQTVNKGVAIKYGLTQQQRRPMLPDNWVEVAEREADEQRQFVDDGLGRFGRRLKAQRPESEPTPDYDNATGGRVDRTVAVPDGRAPPAPPLSFLLRQSLLGNPRGTQPPSSLRQKSEIGAGEKQQNPFDLMANATNAFMSSTFRDEHPKKIMMFGDGGGSTKTKTVVDVRL